MFNTCIKELSNEKNFYFNSNYTIDIIIIKLFIKGEFIYDKSDYNSLVPSWMQIGATDESEKVEETKLN